MIHEDSRGHTAIERIEERNVVHATKLIDTGQFGNSLELGDHNGRVRRDDFISQSVGNVDLTDWVQFSQTRSASNSSRNPLLNIFSKQKEIASQVLHLRRLRIHQSDPTSTLQSKVLCGLYASSTASDNGYLHFNEPGSRLGA
jgi:hypothetical protein